MKPTTEKKIGTIGHADNGKSLLLIALAAGVFSADWPRIAGLPKKDCANCLYLGLLEPGESGYCYMFEQEPQHETCGQFREQS